MYGGTIKFLTERTNDAMLFPRPGAGEVVQISPPGLAWLPAEGASNYRVEIQNSSGALIYEKTSGNNPVHLPDQSPLLKGGLFSAAFPRGLRK